MLLEKQANQVPPVPNAMPVERVTSYWVQEGSLGIARQAIIHLGDCPLCEEGRKAAGQDRWYGPFDDLVTARDISDQLSDIAMRAECRCARKNAAQDLPTLALLNEPLFRKPDSKPAPKAKEAEKAKEQEPRKSARVLAAEAKARKAKRAKIVRYSAIGIAAALAIAVSLFVIPAMSVVEASGHTAASPFLLTNKSPLPLSNIQAECSVQLQPSALRLQNSQQQLADSLGSKGQLTIPCFQAAGGAVPQVRGATVRMKVKYDVLGVHHVTQDFSFVAAHSAEGFATWVLKGQS